MSMSDTISDLLTRLRNAQNSSKENVSIPFSKMKHSICQVLLNEGYIDKIDIDDLSFIDHPKTSTVSKCFNVKFIFCSKLIRIPLKRR